MQFLIPSHHSHTIRCALSGKVPFSQLIQITQGDRPAHNLTNKNNHQPYMVKIPVEGG